MRVIQIFIFSASALQAAKPSLSRRELEPLKKEDAVDGSVVVPTYFEVDD